MTLGGPDGQILGPAQWTMQREWHKAENTSVCPGCGLVMPVHAGPTHAYMGASPACWRLYGQASTLSWGRRDGLPLLRLVVDAYGAQHPGTEQVRAVKSVAVHLMGLCTILERGAHAEPRIIPARERRPPPRTRLDLHWLEPPRPIGTLTIQEPVEATGGQDHAVRVEAWARDVWAAWQPHHGTVRDWVDRAAPREF
jgi:Family of unknown function (DUF5946)